MGRLGKTALALHRAKPKSNSQQAPPAPKITSLLKIKLLAQRQRVWYRALNHLERGIIDLTVRYVDSIKSSRLAKVITAIIDKLQTAMQSKVDRLTRQVGIVLAQKAANIAVSWGNRNAQAWGDDLAFARYLAVMNLNSR